MKPLLCGINFSIGEFFCIITASATELDFILQLARFYRMRMVHDGVFNIFIAYANYLCMILNFKWGNIIDFFYRRLVVLNLLPFVGLPSKMFHLSLANSMTTKYSEHNQLSKIPIN
jgi:hypothetical protein